MEKDSRSRLLAAAIPLFAEKGFAAVSIRELAEKAGINSAMISYYFGSKEGLYAAVLDFQFSRITTAVANSRGLSPLERIRHYGKNAILIHRQCPYLMRYIQSEINTPTACFEVVIRRHISSAYRFLHETIVDGVAAGDFRSDLDPDYAALALAGIINFYFFTKPLASTFLPPEKKLDHDYVMQALEIYLNGVVKK